MIIVILMLHQDFIKFWLCSRGLKIKVKFANNDVFVVSTFCCCFSWELKCTVIV